LNIQRRRCVDLDLIVRGAQIADGTGGPWFKGTVGVSGDRIEIVSRTPLDIQGCHVIDASGKILCPGVIDLHTHSDFTILHHGGAENALKMGVTTEAVGQCGFSSYGITENEKETLRARISRFADVPPSKVDVDWESLEGWRQRIEFSGTAINIVPMIGHGTVRQSVLGPEGRGGEESYPTSSQLAAMKNLVRQAMEDGAFGLSSGLRYPPGRNAHTDEVIALASVAAEFGGTYISHLRSEEEYLISSVGELLTIARQSGIPASVTHHKALIRENWGKVSETLRMMDRARGEGVEVVCDFYPWTLARQANVGSYFIGDVVSPRQSGVSGHEMVRLVSDDEQWARIKRTLAESIRTERAVNRERRATLNKAGIQVPDLWDPETFDFVVWSPSRPDLEGLNFAQIRDVLGGDDYWEAVRHLYLEDEGLTQVAAGGISEGDIEAVLTWPWSCVSTDGFAVDGEVDLRSPSSGVHPRQYGTYPRVLGEWVREKRLVGLEEAVRKMTALPAGFLGLKDRGVIREGARADMVIFDPVQVQCRADHARPQAPPDGIDYVVVNGQVAVREGEVTGARAGEVLRRQ